MVKRTGGLRLVPGAHLIDARSGFRLYAFGHIRVEILREASHRWMYRVWDVIGPRTLHRGTEPTMIAATLQACVAVCRDPRL